MGEYQETQSVSTVKGAGPDAPVITNEKGGQQSKAAYAFHLIPDIVMLDLAERFQYGQERGYARDNWMLIPAEEHYNHMLIHYHKVRAGDVDDNHRQAFICRAAMCAYMLWKEYEQDVRGRRRVSKVPRKPMQG